MRSGCTYPAASMAGVRTGRNDPGACDELPNPSRVYGRPRPASPLVTSSAARTAVTRAGARRRGETDRQGTTAPVDQAAEREGEGRRPQIRARRQGQPERPVGRAPRGPRGRQGDALELGAEMAEMPISQRDGRVTDVAEARPQVR